LRLYCWILKELELQVGRTHYIALRDAKVQVAYSKGPDSAPIQGKQRTLSEVSIPTVPLWHKNSYTSHNLSILFYDMIKDVLGPPRAERHNVETVGGREGA